MEMTNGKHYLGWGYACRIFLFYWSWPRSPLLEWHQPLVTAPLSLRWNWDAAPIFPIRVPPPPVHEKGNIISWTESRPFPLVFLPFGACPGCSVKHLFYWTPSGTYSIRSPGWHSRSLQSVSRFSHDTPCWFRNFCKVDWLRSPSVLILFVL